MHTDGIPTKSGAKPEVMNMVRAAVVNFVIGIIIINKGMDTTFGVKGNPPFIQRPHIMIHFIIYITCFDEVRTDMCSRLNKAAERGKDSRKFIDSGRGQLRGSLSPRVTGPDGTSFPMQEKLNDVWTIQAEEHTMGDEMNEVVITVNGYEKIGHIARKIIKVSRATGTISSDCSGARASAVATSALSASTAMMPANAMRASVTCRLAPLGGSMDLGGTTLNVQINWPTTVDSRAPRMKGVDALVKARSRESLRGPRSFKQRPNALASANNMRQSKAMFGRITMHQFAVGLETHVPNMSKNDCRKPNYVIQKRIFKTERHTHVSVRA